MKVFYDVDTQNDFMNADGGLPVPYAEDIKPNLLKLTRVASAIPVPIVGSVDKHFGTEEYKAREGELERNGGPFPDHCMARTHGQRKIAQTFAVLHSFIPGSVWQNIFVPHYLDNRVQWDVLEQNVSPVTLGAAGIYFEKQGFDAFVNPALDAFLRLAKVDEAVVYGVATDYCVRAAVLGMQGRGIQTYVVEDAIKGVDVKPGDSEKALEEMVRAGAKLVKTKEVVE